MDFITKYKNYCLEIRRRILDYILCYNFNEIKCGLLTSVVGTTLVSIISILNNLPIYTFLIFMFFQSTVWAIYYSHRYYSDCHNKLSELKRAKHLQSLLYSWESMRHSDYNIYGEVEPAEEFSGDFFYYDIEENGNNLVKLFIGDVHGHGLDSAFWMVLMLGSIHHYNTIFRSSDEIHYIINRSISNMNLDRERGIALSSFNIDTESDTMEYTISGMPNIIRLRDGVVKEIEYGHERLPLGLMRNFDIDNRSLDIEEDDRYIICSDGVLEAENYNEEQFDDYIEDAILETKDLTAEEAVKDILDKVNEFSKCREDDRTVVIIDH